MLRSLKDRITWLILLFAMLGSLSLATAPLTGCGNGGNSGGCVVTSITSPGGGQVVVNGNFGAGAFPSLILGNPPNTQSFPLQKDAQGNWFVNTGLPSGTYKASVFVSGGCNGTATGVPVNGIRINN